MHEHQRRQSSDSDHGSAARSSMRSTQSDGPALREGSIAVNPVTRGIALRRQPGCADGAPRTLAVWAPRGPVHRAVAGAGGCRGVTLYPSAIGGASTPIG